MWQFRVSSCIASDSRRRQVLHIAVVLLVGIALVMAGCSTAPSTSAAEGPQSSESPSGDVRRSVDMEADLHVEMPEFSFDLPSYWLGKVDVVETDRGSVMVYPRGNDDCAFMHAGALDSKSVEMGDIGSMYFYRESMGNGRCILLSTTMYTLQVIGHTDWREREHGSYSLEGIEASIDLQTGGRLTADSASSLGRDDTEETIRTVNGYLNSAVTPSLVTHPENSSDVSSSAYTAVLDVDAGGGAMLEGVYEYSSNESIEFSPDGTFVVNGFPYKVLNPGEYEYDPFLDQYRINVHGDYNIYEVRTFATQGEDLVMDDGRVFRKAGGADDKPVPAQGISDGVAVRYFE